MQSLQQPQSFLVTSLKDCCFVDGTWNVPTTLTFVGCVCVKT